MKWNFVADAVGGSLAGATKDNAETTFLAQNVAMKQENPFAFQKTVKPSTGCHTVLLHPLSAQVW